jgi:hypothetical protein
MPVGVERAVTAAAQDDEIFFAVRPQLASPYYVMDLELIAPAAVLAFPAVPLQDFQLELAVTLGGEVKLPSFSKVTSHADSRMSHRNCCWCAAGRNAKNRDGIFSGRLRFVPIMRLGGCELDAWSAIWKLGTGADNPGSQ